MESISQLRRLDNAAHNIYGSIMPVKQTGGGYDSYFISLGM
jgi:hypothetical protein